MQRRATLHSGVQHRAPARRKFPVASKGSAVRSARESTSMAPLRTGAAAIVPLEKSNTNPPSSVNANELPSWRITDPRLLWANDDIGAHVAMLSNLELTLTKKSKESGELSPYYHLKYDFNNTFRGGTMDGDQTLQIDLLDGSGNVIKKILLSFAVPRSRCWARRVEEQGFMSFDWEGKNPQRLNVRITPVKGLQKPC